MTGIICRDMYGTCTFLRQSRRSFFDAPISKYAPSTKTVLAAKPAQHGAGSRFLHRDKAALPPCSWHRGPLTSPPLGSLPSPFTGMGALSAETAEGKSSVSLNDQFNLFWVYFKFRFPKVDSSNATVQLLGNDLHKSMAVSRAPVSPLITLNALNCAHLRLR
eukprot:5463292-Pleurochrysis_carterae.AAC.3